MDVNSQRVGMIAGKSIEEATERLNQFLEVCEVQQVEVQDVEYYALQDRESEDRHSYLVRYDRYSKREKEAYLLAKGVNRVKQVKQAWNGMNKS